MWKKDVQIIRANYSLSLFFAAGPLGVFAVYSLQFGGYALRENFVAPGAQPQLLSQQSLPSFYHLFRLTAEPSSSIVHKQALWIHARSLRIILRKHLKMARTAFPILSSGGCRSTCAPS